MNNKKLWIRRSLIAVLAVSAVTLVGVGVHHRQALQKRAGLIAQVLRGEVEVVTPPLLVNTITPANPCASVLESTIGDSEVEADVAEEGAAENEQTGSTQGQPASAQAQHQPLPPPVNSVRKRCEFGRVEIILGAGQQSGHRHGFVVPILLTIKSDPDIVFDFSTLEQGTIELEGSEFVLYGKPDIEKTYDGVSDLAWPDRLREAAYILRFAKRSSLSIVNATQQSEISSHWSVRLKLQSFVPHKFRPALPLVVNLRYAIALTADGVTPNWQLLESPPLVITTSPTAFKGMKILDGDINPVPARRTAWPYILIAIGIIGSLIYPGVLLIGWLKSRQRLKKADTAEAVAWRQLIPIFASCGETPSNRELLNVVAVLREYLAVADLSTEEALQKLSAHKRLALIELLLRESDKVIFAEEHVIGLQLKQIRRGIKKVIPKPWYL